MRRCIGRSLAADPIGSAASKTLNPSSSSFLFSTSSSSDGGGPGRGRGRGSSSAGPSTFSFTPGGPGKADSGDLDPEPRDFSSPNGLGHGRGKPIPTSPILPSFSSWTPSVTPPTPAGRGRSEGPKQPIFFHKEEVSEIVSNISTRVTGGDLEEGVTNFPSGILPGGVSGGAGRGKHPTAPVSGQDVQDENRHLRAPPGRGRGGEVPEVRSKQDGPILSREEPEVRNKQAGPKLSREDAVQKALGILSQGGAPGRGVGELGRGGGGRGISVRGGGGGRGFRGRGGRGGRGQGGRGRRDKDVDDNAENSVEKMLAKRFGPVKMNQLADAFKEISSGVLRSPADDAYLDAFNVNYAKIKPLLMGYEKFRSDEEWEELVEETLKTVPLLKEIVDHHNGPDRVAAKKQQEDLERVVDALPQSAPSSVTTFANRTVLSLQNNPGWGFDKKRQFMDKLGWQVSRQFQ